MLNSEQINPDDLFEVLDASIKKKTLVGHHIDSFNSFSSKGLKQIITQLFKVENTIINERKATAEDNEIESIAFSAQFTDARLSKPVIKYSSGLEVPLFPSQARINRINYSSSLYIDAKITATAYLKGSNETRVKPAEFVENFKIADLPIMVGTQYCNIGNFEDTPRGVRQQCLQEDPQDYGGYFELEGNEWVVSNIETRLYNQPHVFRNVGHEKEIARLEFISKPGDAFENSSELIMRYVTNKNIYLTFTSNEYLKSDIPFYIIFRLLGMTIDKEIIDNIVYGYGDIISDHMIAVIKDAMNAPDNNFGRAKDIIDQRKLLEYFSEQTSIIHKIRTGIAGTSLLDDEKSRVYLSTNILKWLDKYLLPHIGLSADSRNIKLRYLGHMIHKLLSVEFKIIPSTDRDSLKGKRINAAGRSYAKSFKRDFNTVIVQPIKKRLTNEFIKTPFMSVQMAHAFKSAVTPVDLEKAMNQSIKTGNKEITIKNRQMPNRLASELLNRKNQLNTLSTLRVIRTPSTSASKQNQRADEMRRVHPSYIGYICVIQSADTGESVGMVKQMAISAFISESGISELLKSKLLEDKHIIPLNKVFPQNIYDKMLAKVFVNGDWIGCCVNPVFLATRYREYRRGNGFNDFEKYTEPLGHRGIDPYTTIVWDTNTNEVHFWVDAGRMMRPILVVRNNGELDPYGRKHFGKSFDPYKHFKDGEDTGFRQDILLTKELLNSITKGDKEIDIDYLQFHGIIDYISPEEMENCFICPSLYHLREQAKNPLLQYTHCEIPQCILGIPALASPYPQHIQLPRLTIQTNQGKQTNGICVLNWPYRYDKALRVQFYVETPLVKTAANRYIYPNGLNALVAIACYGGYNQEDSLLYNVSAAQRGEYKILNSGFIQSKRDKGEIFGNPEREYTVDLKMHANYGHLKNGVPPKGTVLKRNDIVIGKFAEMPENEGKLRDISIIYPHNEESYVSNDPTILHDQSGNEFITVRYNSIREITLGQKFSSRAGQKGETSLGLGQEDLLFTADGLVPFLTVNPHALPSRMTVSQLIEGQEAKANAIRGIIGDATIFRRADIDAIGNILEANGYNRYGTEKMFNGMTGEWFDYELFFTPTYYQRLQKFVEEEVYAISTGPTCAITRQPLEGKANKGGLRIGEMEKDVLISHGSSRFLMEKFRDDSDGIDLYVCRTCGKIPIVNEVKEIYNCKNCRKRGLNSDIVKVPSTWSSKLFIQELESMNVGVILEVSPFTYEVKK